MLKAYVFRFAIAATFVFAAALVLTKLLPLGMADGAD